MNSRKTRVMALVLALVILALSVAPALAGFDAGEGVSGQLAARYPAGMLRAEGYY